MVAVSTKYFYFSKFGGYAGLQSCLEDDFVDIPNHEDGELTLPGTYTGAQIVEMQSHGHGHYTVEFGYPNGVFLHREDVHTSNVRWFSRLLSRWKDVQFDLILTEETKDCHTTGKLFDTYYLIDSRGAIVQEFDSVKALVHYIRARSISLRRMRVYDVRNITTSKSSHQEVGT